MENFEKQPLLAYATPSVKFWMLLLLFFLSLLVFSLIGMLILMPFSGVNGLSGFGEGFNFNDPQVIVGLKLAQTVSAIGTFILPAFIFSRLVSKNSFDFLKLNSKPKFQSVFVVALLMVATLPLINWMAELNSKMLLPGFLSDLEQWMKESEEKAKKITEAFLQMNNVLDLFVNLLIVAFLAAFSEELMFRGVIQKLLGEWIKNKNLAIWITAIIFSTFHFQFYGLLPRMILGALLGYLFIWSDSLWLPIFAHFMNNGMAVLFQYLIVKGIVPKNIENIGENIEMVFLLPSLIITVTAIFYLRMIELKKGSNIS